MKKLQFLIGLEHDVFDNLSKCELQVDIHLEGMKLILQALWHAKTHFLSSCELDQLLDRPLLASRISIQSKYKSMIQQGS